MSTTAEMAVAETRGAGEPPTIERLHALASHGYRPDLGATDTPDVIWLDHPISGQPRIIVYGDGKIAVLPHGADSMQIRPDDNAGFRRFVSGVPVPSWWQRGADTRIGVLFYAGLVLAWVMLYATGAWVWDVARSLL
ncbi:hypothetical protein CRT60_00870 [Azospirillum palustre]|uniref:Uncharacterized protein n=1 Tax=Azospirillum palustre TaxID=2044885 RepID=A0A2B8BPQ5_9PROT|nr:hypothetical protein [Azospirillum palustre]PGH59217.1 hypothetical protein CRT60_00870 [Azospirillum palustre]